ncbi:MAG TPA: ribosome maturation factor RimM [Salinisphaeraceae bacterium]|nr:ribosome maturation factor RimM [Salinisphaeraceae bacterium]
MPEKKIVLGRISGLFGIHGWVKLYSHTRPVGNLLTYKRWFLNPDVAAGRQPDWRLFHVLDARLQGRTLVAQLATATGHAIDNRDAAVALLDADIAVARSALPPLPPGQYYWHDLIGLEVVNRAGVVLGRVDSMLETGANDVLVVEGECQRLIPFVVDVIVDAVDFAAARIHVDWEADF